MTHSLYEKCWEFLWRKRVSSRKAWKKNIQVKRRLTSEANLYWRTTILLSCKNWIR